MVAPLLRTDRPAFTYWLTRFFILRLLGIVYAVAFLVAANQILPLIGSHGLLPIQLFIDHVHQALGTNYAGFARLPSLFWFAHSDVLLLSTAWAGFALSCLVALGFANSILLTVLWLLYMSFVHIGQDWYSYGWETQLLETGFLAIFLAPFFDPQPFPRKPPPVVIIWLFRWLIFRIMIGSALIKLRGDPAWRDLSALYYYFETQPIPNPLSRFFHFLPRPLLQGGTVFNFLAELIAPWFVFWPQIARHIAGGVIVAFLFTIAISGNLSFLNWLTVIPALACFDDSLWLKICPTFLRRWQRAAMASAAANRATQVLAYALACMIAFLSI
ncbi:MAG: lipase maturation factor family protein, partial [Verrucomicrobia bacterium]|nr:lipase maturation factor family protein [Verrucomicrobiota bacterium]